MLNLSIWTLGAGVWWFCFAMSEHLLDFAVALVYTAMAAWFWAKQFPLERRGQ